MGPEIVVSPSTQRFGQVRVLGLTIGLLIAGCGGQSNDQDSLKSPELQAFEACLEAAGYTTDDFELFPQNMTEGEGAPRQADWDLQLQIGTCINQSGVGESVVGDPEAIAQRTERALALTRCMKDRGWSEFPDPVPHPAPYDDGLTHTRIDMPTEPEAREAFTNDFAECEEADTQ